MRGLIHRDRGSVIRPLLYLQAATAGYDKCSLLLEFNLKGKNRIMVTLTVWNLKGDKLRNKNIVCNTLLIRNNLIRVKVFKSINFMHLLNCYFDSYLYFSSFVAYTSWLVNLSGPILKWDILTERQLLLCCIYLIFKQV